MTMNPRELLFAPLIVLLACSGPPSDAGIDPAGETAVAGDQDARAGAFEIAPGLSARIVKEGHGATAEAGQIAVVHYTGWLYDASAEGRRGAKFDSSIDRDEYFSFMLGAGRVIKGWDQGVVGMQVGEIRELTIAPEMGYGDRGAGNVIPPGATLLFEVQLAELHGSE